MIRVITLLIDNHLSLEIMKLTPTIKASKNIITLNANRFVSNNIHTFMITSIKVSITKHTIKIDRSVSNSIKIQNGSNCFS